MTTDETKAMVVIKPWGREYLCYKNEEVAIWVLELRQREATSLHCHPKKNTALIVLDGTVDLSFIRDKRPHRMRGLDKINIFRGRFHQTRAVLGDAVLLEVEAPDDKRDILRLDDDYGRESLPIEEATQPLVEPEDLQLKDPDILYRFSGCFMRISKLLSADVLVTLKGGLEHGLVPPGDAIDGATMARFADKFAPLPQSQFLHIWRASA